VARREYKLYIPALKLVGMPLEQGAESARYSDAYPPGSLNAMLFTAPATRAKAVSPIAPGVPRVTSTPVGNNSLRKA